MKTSYLTPVMAAAVLGITALSAAAVYDSHVNIMKEAGLL